MMVSCCRASGRRLALAGAGWLALAGLTGCQVDVGGQTLPSAYYMSDDVQYFPAGPEFKLANEAAALAAARAEEGLPAPEAQPPLGP
jgi:hypothetical protein